MNFQLGPYSKILCLAFSFVLLLQLVGTLSFHANSKKLKEFDPWQPAYSNATVPLFARWDSGWYAAVAKYGYYLNPGQNSTVVFFPLYPLLIKGLSQISPLDYFYAGQLISWLALLLALGYFYKLLRLDYGEKQSLSVLLFLLIFPWSFFLAAVYTESLFLLLVTAAFYYARKQNWLLAGLLGFLAALTRITGVLLLPALAYEYLAQNQKLGPRIFWLALIPAGLATFMFYLKLKTGYFFAFVYNQASFGRQSTFPLKTLWWDLKNTLHFFQQGDMLKALVYTLAFLALAASLWLLAVKWRELRGSYLLFASLSILLPLCTGTTTSLGRYLLSVFPMFIAAGLVQNRLFKFAWFSLGLIALLVLTFAFVGWYFVV